jgi:hypothetical protein
LPINLGQISAQLGYVRQSLVATLSHYGNKVKCFKLGVNLSLEKPEQSIGAMQSRKKQYKEGNLDA